MGFYALYEQNGSILLKTLAYVWILGCLTLHCSWNSNVLPPNIWLEMRTWLSFGRSPQSELSFFPLSNLSFLSTCKSKTYILPKIGMWQIFLEIITINKSGNVLKFQKFNTHIFSYHMLVNCIVENRTYRGNQNVNFDIKVENICNFYYNCGD